ncbi:2OG-Fe(II) oxygenase [Pseudomonas otitidis]|uniref:2OG-Fe(II) oxygenase n=1 Tax=Metapseudomonas otitidis TaxID=319939 RepID=UPI002447D1D7|nr:2OG-Fe(II) oxygenase [Pseudomonas otitidis]MDH1109508.1 2OG-Fe(II) oxygenase [Pseudomonas otitidis]MDH1161936.1 2OG-Fe(II) oxygenase [Pseudomonas otitidis]MDH1167587.1 2OG-Fe(II) oxygenase [Pseudomonas otitidis]
MDRTTLTQEILNKLDEHTEAIRQQWNHPVGTRTRHFVIDELLPADVTDAIYAAFPKDAEGFYNRESFREKKRTSASLDQYDPLLSEITYAFQSPEVVDKVAEIVGFDDLEPDPSLYAGGLSMMFEGDFLNPHLDNSHDAKRNRYRRLNLLFYVSPDWEEKNGGNFELWDDERKNAKVIVSQFNRLVVMETNKHSWHSVNAVKTSRPRCCVSNYFFSVNSPDNSDYFHVTSFSGRPEEIGKRALGAVDNALRNTVSKILKTGRGKGLINKSGD